MAIDVKRELDELYPRSQLYTPRYYIAKVFPRLNKLLVTILNEGAMADFQVFFDRVVSPAAENGAASDPALVDWRQACRDFAYYMDDGNYRAVVEGNWLTRFEKPHILWFFRNLRLYLPWLGRITLAKRASRQNWYTTSVDWPQFASMRHRSMCIAAPSSRVNSRER